MTIRTDNPTLELATKFGTLLLTFTDPAETPDADRYGNKASMRDKHVLCVSGELVINRIPVRVSTRLAYAPVFYKAGVELDAPEIVLEEDYRCSYHRRTDVQFGAELTPGARNTLRSLWNTVVREAYEARPDLVRAAQRARLAQAVERAEGERDSKYAEYMKAEKAVSDARAAQAAGEA